MTLASFYIITPENNMTSTIVMIRAKQYLLHVTCRVHNESNCGMFNLFHTKHQNFCLHLQSHLKALLLTKLYSSSPYFWSTEHQSDHISFYSMMFSLLPSTSSWMTENLLSTQGEFLFLRLPPALPGLAPCPGSWIPALAWADLSSSSRAVGRWGLGPSDCCANSFLKSWSEVFLGVIETGPESDRFKKSWNVADHLQNCLWHFEISRTR